MDTPPLVKQQTPALGQAFRWRAELDPRGRGGKRGAESSETAAAIESA
jgi:hypothetical protein